MLPMSRPEPRFEDFGEELLRELEDDFDIQYSDCMSSIAHRSVPTSQEVVGEVAADRFAALPKLTDRSQRTILEMR